MTATESLLPEIINDFFNKIGTELSRTYARECPQLAKADAWPGCPRASQLVPSGAFPSRPKPCRQFLLARLTEHGAQLHDALSDIGQRHAVMVVEIGCVAFIVLSRVYFLDFEDAATR